MVWAQIFTNPAINAFVGINYCLTMVGTCDCFLRTIVNAGLCNTTFAEIADHKIGLDTGSTSLVSDGQESVDFLRTAQC
jgi:hypothetical protein